MHPRTDEQMRQVIFDRTERIPESGCWAWMRGLDADGYPQVSYRNKNVAGHRLSYLLFVGKIPEGHVVMHRCDTPCCVNPHHLDTGTNAENTADRQRKGRCKVASGDSHYLRRNPLLRSGERCPTAVLKESDVLQIRDLSSQGVNQHHIARKFGVSRAAISAIVIRRTWKHIL